MEIIEALKEKFQVWYLEQRQKFLNKQIAILPSENQDDYFFDNLTNQFVYKDTTFNTQIGLENILNVIKTRIESMEINVENLQAVISYIANINIDTTALTAIITDINSLTAIINDIANVDINIDNLQAIIADIANIESLSNTISGNITNLTAIINNIATMNTNIDNLQAIIADIANIESQQITMNTAIANINTNIGLINSAIANIETTNADIDIDIGQVKDLQIDISEQVYKTTTYSGTINASSSAIIGAVSSEYMFNAVSIFLDANYSGNINFLLWLAEPNQSTDILRVEIIDGRLHYIQDYFFKATKDMYLSLFNQSGSGSLDYEIKFFYTPQTRVNTFQNKCYLPASTTHEYRFVDLNLLNRLSYVFNGVAEQDYDIEIYNKVYASGSIHTLLIASKNITGIADAVLSGTISFVSTSDIYIKIINNNPFNTWYDMNLFFSKNFKPELDEHIDDSTIHFTKASIKHSDLDNDEPTKHFLESSINLASINEKSYNSLTDKPTTPFLPIGTILMYSGTWTDNSTIIGWYKCDGNNGTPNLVNKFIRGATTSGATGGSDNAVVVNHTHSHTHVGGNHYHNSPQPQNIGNNDMWGQDDILSASASTYEPDNSCENNEVASRTNNKTIGTLSTDSTGASGGVSALNRNIPAYYALIFIMRIS